MKQLKEEYKVGVVVDLNDKKSEAKAAKQVGMKYIGKRMNSLVPAPSLLEALTKTIDREVEAGQRVYVHCHKGIYRAPTVAIAYLIYKGMKTDGAVKKVKERRPSALPGIENSEKLIPMLKTFENNLRSRPGLSK